MLTWVGKGYSLATFKHANRLFKAPKIRSTAFLNCECHKLKSSSFVCGLSVYYYRLWSIMVQVLATLRLHACLFRPLSHSRRWYRTPLYGTRKDSERAKPAFARKYFPAGTTKSVAKAFDKSKPLCADPSQPTRTYWNCRSKLQAARQFWEIFPFLSRNAT